MINVIVAGRDSHIGGPIAGEEAILSNDVQASVLLDRWASCLIFIQALLKQAAAFGRSSYCGRIPAFVSSF
jgi:hypothetical protein